MNNTTEEITKTNENTGIFFLIYGIYWIIIAVIASSSSLPFINLIGYQGYIYSISYILLILVIMFFGFYKRHLYKLVSSQNKVPKVKKQILEASFIPIVYIFFGHLACQYLAITGGKGYGNVFLTLAVLTSLIGVLWFSQFKIIGILLFLGALISIFTPTMYNDSILLLTIGLGHLLVGLNLNYQWIKLKTL